ncbi:hypothetical protein AVEN_76150-1 [Araneus ventricosus]|uniref:Uncharacterized protein n=1 Tax=Araneus ventricosus TaxID=182803 RepID=A0A4Y2E6Q7_ARAVE|nr:hypothetical protein AVEN_76150-1 [Araneus ventricosus]
MELNRCRLTRKPIVSAITVENGFNFLSSIKIGLLSSEEMSCCLMSQNNGHTRVRSKPHEEIDPSCRVPTVQANGGSIIIWGASMGLAWDQQHCTTTK